MDNREHKLDAPNEEALRTIEQLEDHSDLTTIYRQVHTQFDGEIVGKDERERRRQKAEDTISFGIRKWAWLVGLLAPMPFILLALLLVGTAWFMEKVNINFLVFPMIFAFALWVIVSFALLKRIFKIFYKNALSAVPFLANLYIVLALSVQIILVMSIPFDLESSITFVVVMSGAVLLISLIFSALMLQLWTTPVIKGEAKVGIIATITLLIALFTMYLTFLV